MIYGVYEMAPIDGKAGSSDEPAALVVESDKDSCHAICSYLKGLGYDVTAVASGVAAVIAARSNPPVVILLAMQLTDVTGAELLTWLRSNPALASVPIIALHSLGEDAPDLGTAGFNARLWKPTSAAKIAEALQKACGAVK
jgi:CheY-like chemotaxis protein